MNVPLEREGRQVAAPRSLLVVDDSEPEREIMTLALGAGCTSLREVPRSEYAAMPERQHQPPTNDSLERRSS